MSVTQAAKKLGLTQAEYYDERDKTNEAVFRIKQALYASYLSSPQWKVLRRQVLTRDHKCRLCREVRAVEVHHLTYTHIFEESLYDLIGVCSECHRYLHLMGIPHWGNLRDVQKSFR